MAQTTKTNLVYTTDLVRGLDVFEVDVPSKDLSAASSPLPTLP